jgi:hypothetical protein
MRFWNNLQQVRNNLQQVRNDLQQYVITFNMYVDIRNIGKLQALGCNKTKGNINVSMSSSPGDVPSPTLYLAIYEWESWKPNQLDVIEFISVWKSISCW